MKVGDLVRMRRNHQEVGVIVSTLNGNGYYDVFRTDGVVIFVHEQSLDVIGESWDLKHVG